MSISTCSSPDFSINKRYDVFLSFRGPDTRGGFVRKLYSAFVGAGIEAFLDEISLEKGEHILSSLNQGIEASKICIPIFSQNFANSKSCLKEVLCMVKSFPEVKICPIFYDVLPSDLRDGGKYQHEIPQTLSPDMIIECKSALRFASDLPGWCLNQYSGEDNLIQAVSVHVVKVLHKVHLDTPKCFGLEFPVEHVTRLLQNDQKKMVKMGICGNSGIGKTTLAKVVCKRLYSHFDVFCFVLDVGGRCEEANGLVKIQNRMLKDLSYFRDEVHNVDRGKTLLEECLGGKKVLLLLDDIQSPQQLEALAGNYTDFGAGSRLIITSHDQQILEVAKVDEVYKVKSLSQKHARQLFNFYAFPNSLCPDQEMETLCKNIVSACEELPLALKIVGNILTGERDRNVWTDMVEKLRREPSLQEKLRTCYDTLTKHEKEMFHDIACFFAFKDEETAIMFWAEQKQLKSLHASLKHLSRKFLVSLGPSNELLMHSCLRDLGKNIENQTSTQRRKRTRLFEEDDVQHVLRRPQENAKRVRYVSYEPKKRKTLKAENFISLCNLELLWLTNVVIEGHFPEACFQNLRWLRWQTCSSKSLPSGMNLSSLVILEVTDSQIAHLWDETTEEDATIRPLKLKVLILSGCASLERLPVTLVYTQLRILDLSNCNSLGSLPRTMENFSSLVSLNMEGCGVSSLPEDFGQLSSLRKLNLSWCKNLSKLPATFGNLTQLERLQIHHNPKLTELPHSIGGLKALIYLNAGHCQLSDDGLPGGLSELSSLRIIHLEHNEFRVLSGNLQKLSALWELHLDGCKDLSLLQALPPSLQILSARECLSLDRVGSLSELNSLMRLDLRNSIRLTEFHGLEALQRLTNLNLVGCKNISGGDLERSLGGLKSLESLYIGGAGMSPTRLVSLYDSIKGISFNKQCLLATGDMTSNWVHGEAGGRNGEEINCVDYRAVENRVNCCAGYIVCCLSLGRVFPRNENGEPPDNELEATACRLCYSIQRDGLRPMEVMHPKMDGGDADVLEVRVVRVDDNLDFDWLRKTSTVTVNACSDSQNWKASFRFLMYEPVDANHSAVEEKPPSRVTFGV